MATEAVLTKQMPYVGTPTQYDIVNDLSVTLKISKAAVMRYALNKALGLVGPGHLPKGVTRDEVMARLIAEMGGADLEDLEPIADVVA